MSTYYIFPIIAQDLHRCEDNLAHFADTSKALVRIAAHLCQNASMAETELYEFWEESEVMYEGIANAAADILTLMVEKNLPLTDAENKMLNKGDVDYAIRAEETLQTFVHRIVGQLLSAEVKDLREVLVSTLLAIANWVEKRYSQKLGDMVYQYLMLHKFQGLQVSLDEV